VRARDPGSLDGIRAALATMAGPELRTGVRWIDARDEAALREIEAVSVERAVARRRHEFATGRALLRELLGTEIAIPVAEDRSPILPDGVRGSLAHDRELVVAAVGRAERIIAVGVDVEPVTALSPDVAAIVLRPDEVGLDAHLAFTMKEAAYKAWSSLGGRMLEHHDVRLELDGTSRSTATGPHTTGGFTAMVVDVGATFTGAWVQAGGRWLSLVAAPARPDAT
jgi:4'-phosphopantetheinyl transferase EntD